MSVDASLAQLDRVTGYEPVGRGFESLTTRQQKAQQHLLLGFLFVYRHDEEPHKSLAIYSRLRYDEFQTSDNVSANRGSESLTTPIDTTTAI